MSELQVTQQIKISKSWAGYRYFFKSHPCYLTLAFTCGLYIYGSHVPCHQVTSLQCQNYVKGSRFKQVLDLCLYPFQMYCIVYMTYLLYLDVLYIWIKYCLHLTTSTSNVWSQDFQGPMALISKNINGNWYARNRIYHGCKGQIVKSVTQDHGLPSLSNPSDVKQWSSGWIFPSTPHNHISFL